MHIERERSSPSSTTCGSSDVNEAPTINETLTRYVLENSPVNTVLPYLNASDQDHNEQLRYFATLPPEAGGLLSAPTTGYILVASDAIDFEKITEFVIPVRSCQPANQHTRCQSPVSLRAFIRCRC
jgi:hypothetical protein